VLFIRSKPSLSLTQKGDGRRIIYKKHLSIYARTLRKEMTGSELFLWSKIRLKQLNAYQFYRQCVIDRYIVDFFCPRARLVIEVDGGQHYSDEMIEDDKKRDYILNIRGLKVLRFNNTDVLSNIDGVVGKIIADLPDEKQKLV
jgi:very-short-patch-repair endonuclease